jgi:anti-anti-sigma factor
MFSWKIEKTEMDVSIKFIGDLDIEATEMIEDEMIPVIAAYRNIVLDFSDVSFVDSTGIGLLINLIDTKEDNLGMEKVLIKNIQPLVREVFDILQLEEILGEKAVLSGV